MRGESVAMDARIARLIQREAADAILDAGVRLPLKGLRVPWRRRRLVLRVTMRRPRMAGQIRFARAYLGLGVTAAELADLDKDGQLRLIAEHGGSICEMVACALCTGVVTGRFVKPVGWLLGHCVEWRYLVGAVQQFVSMMGTDPFIPIIRLAERTNPMKLRLSRRMREESQRAAATVPGS